MYAIRSYYEIYKDALSSANLISTYTSTAIPSGPINVPSGIAIVQFFADANNNAQGWSLNYTSSTSDIKENKVMSNMIV